MNKLSEFPTEALLHEYRRRRYCRQESTYKYYIRYIGGKREVWENVYGLYEGYTECLYMKLSDKTAEEVLKEHTDIKSKDDYDTYEYVPEKHRYMTIRHKDRMIIHFGKLKWEGTMTEIKAELAKRPNVNIDGEKTYRRWLQNYRKNLKK